MTGHHSGMDVGPSGRDNHSGPGRGGDLMNNDKRKCRDILNNSKFGILIIFKNNNKIKWIN